MAKKNSGMIEWKPPSPSEQREHARRHFVSTLVETDPGVIRARDAAQRKYDAQLRDATKGRSPAANGTVSGETREGRVGGRGPFNALYSRNSSSAGGSRGRGGAD